MFVTPRDDDTFPLRRFAPNVGAPLVTPGIPPHPRHQGRFIAACFRRAARPLRHETTTRFLCARFAPNVGAPPRTPGIPPHPRHHGRFIAACFRRAARPLRRGTTRCVPIATVHVVPCRAPGVMNGAPTVHCRTFHCAACSLRHGTTIRFLCARFAPNVGAPLVTPGRPPHPRHHGRFIAARSIVPHVRYATKRRHVSFAPVRTKRRAATPDARNTDASAPSWTVHRRAFHCAACSLRHGTTTRFLCARFAPNAGPPPRTPGRPPHPRHHGRFTAACPR